MTNRPVDCSTALPRDARRRVAPAVERNRDPILAVLRQVFPHSGDVLEIASGTGEHGAYFCAQLPELTWQPSDVDADNLQSIVAWTEALNLSNLKPPLSIDLLHPPRPPSERYDAAFCANLIHIAPWSVCVHLMQLVATVLKPNAPLVMYGPYKLNGAHTAESNVRFEQWLWSLDPSYGVRDVSDVQNAARLNHLELVDQIIMPANNYCLVFNKRDDQ